MKIKTCSAYLAALVFLFGFAARDAIGLHTNGSRILNHGAIRN